MTTTHTTEIDHSKITRYVRMSSGKYYVVTDIDGDVVKGIRDMTETERNFRRFNVRLAIGEVSAR